MAMSIDRATSSKAASSGGFSLIELLLVVAIILAITAIAVPNFMQAYYNIRLKETASDLSGLIQRTRITAARQNSIIAMLYTTGTPRQAYIDLNGNGQLDYGEATITFPTNVTPAASAPATPYVLSGDTGSGSVYTNSTTLGFSSRGLPCAYVAGSPPTCTTPAANYFVYYLTDQRAGGSTNQGWAAVIVTKSGRSKVSLWNGSSWN
jgi:prepilin-type N-terminal cleavage/methylation domain-containing protein